MARTAQIVSTARYLPERAVTNAELTKRFAALGRPTVIDRLASSTGIMQRFYAPDSWATSDLAVPAAKEALKRAGRKPENVDLIIVGTTSPDYITPDTSVVLQHKLGAKNAGIFDVDCACASFPALIAVASGLIATTAMKTILVVGVDMIHRLSDPNDPGCFLWGDGAGAAVVEGGTNPGFIGAAFQADGAYASGWGILAGGTFEPASMEAVKAAERRCVELQAIIPRPLMKKIGRAYLNVSVPRTSSRQTMWISCSSPKSASPRSRLRLSGARCRWKSATPLWRNAVTPALLVSR
jgi:3-oxoacyl-[acyl-carrier-protein] synthase-3